MDNHLSIIPFYEILIYLGVGLILLLIFRFISKYVIPSIKKQSNKSSKTWHRIQIGSWLLYSAMFYTALLHKNNELTIISTLLILGLGWNYWRNIFFGVIIKFYNQFNVGDVISTDFVKGKIKTINLEQSKIINDKGELIVVPNFKLRTSILKHLYEKESANSYPFTINVADNKNRDDIYKMIINCPYITANHEIHIERVQKQEYLIRVSIIDRTFIDKINDYFSEN